MSSILLRAAPAALLTGGALVNPAMAAVPQVVADIAPVQSLVARVMAGIGTPGLILPPGASPHDHALRPSEAQALDGAGVVFWVGPALDPWLEKPLAALAGDARIVPLLDSPGTEVLPMRHGATFEAHDHGGHSHAGGEDHDHAAGAAKAEDAPEGEAQAAGADHTHKAATAGANPGPEAAAGAGHVHQHDAPGHAHDTAAGAGHAHEDAKGHTHASHDHAGHDHGDHEHDGHAGDEHAGGEQEHAHEHEGTDPHAWLDPDNARAWLDTIAATLSEADPDNAARYRANADAGKAELTALDGTLRAELAPVAGTPFIVFHDAYQYFEDHFGLRAAGSISLADGAAPGPGRLKEVQDKTRALHIACAFREPQFDPKLIDTVFEGQQVRIGVLDPLGATLTPGPELYPQLLREMAATFVACKG